MFNLLISEAHAQGTSSMMQGGLANLMPIILMVVILYFLVIRPQSKKAKEHKEMVNSLKKGDKVVTSGGMIATVAKITDDNEIMISIAKGVDISVLKNSVTQTISKEISTPKKSVVKEKIKATKAKKTVSRKTKK